MIYYAKSKPVETIKDHTDNLLDEYEELRKNYGNAINRIVGVEESQEFWHLLYKACFYHDFGKYNNEFQSKIKKNMGMEYKTTGIDEIYHNFLSPALMTKEDRKSIKKELRPIFYQAIAYHHERGVIINLQKETEYRKYISNILEEKIKDINADFGINIEKTSSHYLSDIEAIKRITEDNAEYKFYVMLKGLLHRLDHSASAGIKVEELPRKTVGQCTDEYFQQHKWDKREPQLFACDNKENNILLIASTGIGKTETALLWIDDSKAFFTLPLRVSLNALYSRVKDELKYESVGLLHSTALDYMMEEEIGKGNDNFSNVEEVYGESQLLSSKLCFSTIDQIFKFPFKYCGYEKILATLAYSKVVIDEIQAYSPEIAAVLLFGIKEIADMGGKFMIMTATLPGIYKDKLKELKIDFKEKQCLSEKLRHRISIEDDEVMGSIDKVCSLGKDKKVLVIVNTVSKAVEFFNAIKENNPDMNVHLLHSLFINRDRAQKEREVKKFTEDNNKETGIWVSTQLVEASLDVDFDFLFTEMSTLDSLFQRLGRCYRKRSYDLEIPNVYIYTLNVSGVGYIYDKDIFNLSISLLGEYNNMILTEACKVKLVDRLYSKELIKETDYYKKFQKTYELLKDLVSFSMHNKAAQEALRNIDSVTVIPEKIYRDNACLFQKCASDNRRERLRKINTLTLSIPKTKIYGAKNSNSGLELYMIDDLRGIYIVNGDYSDEYGLDLSKLADSFI